MSDRPPTTEPTDATLAVSAAIGPAIDLLATKIAERIIEYRPQTSEPEFTSDTRVAAAAIGMSYDWLKKRTKTAPVSHPGAKTLLWHIPTLKQWALDDFPATDQLARGARQRRS